MAVYGKTIWDDLKHQWKYGDIIVKLIFINVAIFLLENILLVPFTLFNIDFKATKTLFEQYISFHSYWKMALTRIWGLVTYQFFHAGFFHILFNMLWLYVFGKILINFHNTKRILPLYLLGGFAGALLYFVSYNVFPYFKEEVQFSYLIGASASIMAIVFATVATAPYYKIRLFILGEIPILYIAIFSLIMDYFGTIQSNAGGAFAHLGGAAMGYLYIVLLNKGTDLAKPFNRLFDWVVGLFQKKPAMRVNYRNVAPKRGPFKTKRNTSKKQEKTSDNEQERVDAILDKISEKGYDSLSREEKAILFKASSKHD